MLNADKTASAATAVLTPGTILQSRYRIGELLGEGGMGVVFQATDLRLNHTVAIKQILTSDESLWKQFEREAQLLAQLNHPALPRVTDYFTEGNRAFFVMQFVDGVDLAQMIKIQDGPFPQPRVIAWADQLLDALIYLHTRDRQIIHRDIKPHNLKINSGGQVALLDFGLAKSAPTGSPPEATSTSVFGYTPRYAPLEQIQNLGTTPQSDIYALGATLYHLLTGVRPPDALARAAAFVSGRPNPLRLAHEINPSLGPELSSILDRAMSQNPDDRYADAREFRDALRQVGRLNETGSIELCETCGNDSSPIDYRSADFNERTPLRIGTRMIAALILILLSSFGVFCRYYHWKVPRAEPEAVERVALRVSADMASSRDNASKRINHKKR